VKNQYYLRLASKLSSGGLRPTFCQACDSELKVMMSFSTSGTLAFQSMEDCQRRFLEPTDTCYLSCCDACFSRYSRAVLVCQCCRAAFLWSTLS